MSLATAVTGVAPVINIAATLFFIFSIIYLSKHQTAFRGNKLGIIGMALALFVALPFNQVGPLIIILLILGASLFFGYKKANTVQMTELPQLVALLNSFGGLAAALIAINDYQVVATISEHPGASLKELAIYDNIHAILVILSIIIGVFTFVGSVVAYYKLSGVKLKNFTKNIKHPHLFTFGIAVILVLFSIFYYCHHHFFILFLLIVFTVIVSYHIVNSIGAADMPVVISMLNSYSGWSTSAAGFLLANNLLIVTGALIGASGSILSYIMCKAMNRSLLNVLAGDFTTQAASDEPQGTITEIKPEGVAQALLDAQNVIIAPGYGMAVAQAQYPVAELVNLLSANDVNVRFAIHPVAGRLPGHMNVLLAEANVDYEVVLGMDEINDDFASTDVVLVIGANDTVNPAATLDPKSPIAGMPVLRVWEASEVVVFKRSMNTGYAGVQNPLFFNENTDMCFGDAKDTVVKINDAIKALTKNA